MEKDPNRSISLSAEDYEKIKTITSVADVIPEEIRVNASGDIIKTLENNHPLNKIWRDEKGEIIGYLAFEDFAPAEAYVKYFVTEGLKDENPFSAIPDLLDKARSLHYTKIHFHGFNPRLNKALEHFGFYKTHTDRAGGHSADHFEFSLVSEKPKIDQKTKEAFQQKYLNQLIQEVEKTVETLKEAQKQNLEGLERELTTKISNQEDFIFDDKRKLILKLKLARFLQRHDSVDINTLFDAILETPKFLDQDKGGFDRLLEVHEQKTIEKIAEMRKKKAEQKGGEGLNPYEALFETKSGKYYMARLLNMPHLEEESQYMNHCVGTSDSYINKLKKGDVEILSFRKTPTVNPNTQKLEGDEPIITIEYNVRTKTIEQIKKNSDQYLNQDDPFYSDFIDALKQLRGSKTDTGDRRDFKEISSSELGNIEVKDYCLLTENGEVSFKDFDPDSGTFVLKMGKMEINKDIAKEDQVKIFKIVTGVDVLSAQIATNTRELKENTLVYIGPWNPVVMKALPKSVTHIYEQFPDKKVFLRTIETYPNITSPEEAKQALINNGFKIEDEADYILKKVEFSKENKEYDLVSFSAESLGFPNGATTKEIYQKAEELGLELCPAEVGPLLRLQYPDQSNGEYLRIAMKTISDSDGSARLFGVYCYGGASWLGTGWDEPDYRWGPVNRFVFVRRKK